MAKQSYRYTLHRVGAKKALVRGELRAQSLDDVIKKLQKMIRPTVLKDRIPIYMRVWNAKHSADRYEYQYDRGSDFKKFRKRTKWKQEFVRKARRSRKFDPSPKMWFIAVDRSGQLNLTKLAYEPKVKTLLARKRKKLFGPFETEEIANQFKARVEQGIESRMEQTEFTKPEGAQ